MRTNAPQKPNSNASRAKTLLCGLLLCLLSFSGRSQVWLDLKDDSSDVIKMVYEGLKAIYEEKDSVKGLEIWERLQRQKPENPSIEQAAYLFYGAHFQQEMKSSLDSSFLLKTRAVELVRERGIYNNVGLVIYRDIADWLRQLNATDYALQYYKETLDILHNIDYPPHIIWGNTAMNIAWIYRDLNEMDSCNHYFNMALRYADRMDDKLPLSSTYNNYGWIQYTFGKNDKAWTYYDSAQMVLDLSVPDHELFYYNMEENKAHILVKRDRYDEAMQKYEKVIEIRHQHEKPTWALLTEIYRLNHLMERGYMNQAKSIFPHVLRTIDASGYPKMSDYPQFVLSSLKEYYDETGQIEKAFEVADALNVILQRENEANERLTRVDMQHYLRMKRKADEDRMRLSEMQKAELLRKNELQQWYIGLGSLIAIALLVMAYFLHKYRIVKRDRRIEKNRADKMILSLKNENLALSLKNRELDMEKIVLDNRMRLDFTEEFIAKLEDIEAMNGPARDKALRKLKIEMLNKVDVENRLSHLQEHLDTINAAFESRLKEHIPEINQTEIECSALIKLGMTNKEIAAALNRSVPAVKMIRHRIRKKAGLDPFTDLQKFISDLEPEANSLFRHPNN